MWPFSILPSARFIVVEAANLDNAAIPSILPWHGHSVVSEGRELSRMMLGSVGEAALRMFRFAPRSETCEAAFHGRHGGRPLELIIASENRTRSPSVSSQATADRARISWYNPRTHRFPTAATIYIMGFALALHPNRHGFPSWLVTHQTLGGFHDRRPKLAGAGENQTGVRQTRGR